MPPIIAPGPGRPYVTVTGGGGPIDFPQDAAEALLKAQGAVLIRGFAPDAGAFRRFSDPFCSSWVVNEARNRELIDPVHNIQSVDRGVDAFSLHSEMSRAPWRPDVCFFHCLKAPRRGGETTICDGTEITRGLPAEIYTALAGQRFLFARKATPALLRYWLGTETPTPAQLVDPPARCPFRFVWNDGAAFTIFTRPALHRTMFGGGRAFANFLLFARDMHHNRNFPLLADGRPVPDEWVAAARETSARLTAAVAWQAGDLLILDNSRFMHGRNAVIDPAERSIASRFGYLHCAPADPEGARDPFWRHEAFVPPGAMVN